MRGRKKGRKGYAKKGKKSYSKKGKKGYKKAHMSRGGIRL